MTDTVEKIVRNQIDKEHFCLGNNYNNGLCSSPYRLSGGAPPNEYTCIGHLNLCSNYKKYIDLDEKGFDRCEKCEEKAMIGATVSFVVWIKNLRWVNKNQWQNKRRRLNSNISAKG